MGQFTQLASVSLQNARRYELEHETALALQRSLLPPALPAISGIGLAVRYLPAGPGAGVGGDWYDVIQLRDGRLGLVVGDVMGHGIRSAALMGQLRTVVRAYAIEGHSPAQVIARVDRLFQQLAPDQLATVVYAVVEPGRNVCFANAGHPPPLLIEPGGPSRFLTGGLSVPLGVPSGMSSDKTVHHDHTVTLLPGSVLLLYTDGLFERRRRRPQDTLNDFQAAVTRPAASLEHLCDAATAFLDTSHEDDVCLLAVGISDSP
jgi:serine phosphatase RsbU (regulator of sigma subunit)